MPGIKTITDDLGKPMRILNIWSTVGANGFNDPSDVRVIKALLFCVPRTNSTNNSYGKDSDWNIKSGVIPSPYDGTMWGVVELTKSFQKYANKMLSKYGFKVNINGRIKPSNGFAVVGKNYSTLAALNLFASLGVSRGNDSHIDFICKEWDNIFFNLRTELDEDENGD